MTLAYKFDEADLDTLKHLVERLDVKQAVTWELRLYSRDPRVSLKQVYRVTQSYRPREPDELELVMNDLICVNDEAIQATRDGWVEGFSVHSGCSGVFPLNYAYRVPESETWTLHRRVQICHIDELSSLRVPGDESTSRRSSSVDGRRSGDWTQSSTRNPTPNLTPNPTPNATPALTPSVAPTEDLLSTHSTLERKPQTDLFRRMNWNPTIGENIQVPNANQKLFIMRHAERVDYTFTKWTQYCFNENDEYLRLDLNMPKSLPSRPNPKDSWRNDSPITNVGCLQAKLIGEMLRDVRIELEFVYSSPSYRSLETTRALLNGLGIEQTVQIRIEPALFEWCGYYPERVPEFLEIDQLVAADFNVDTEYVPLVTVADLSERCKNESLQEFYERNHSVTEHVTKLTTKNILIVGHAANLETNSRLLLGGKVRTVTEMARLMSKVPYASLLAVEKLNNDEWKIVSSNVLPMGHSKKPQFNWIDFVETDNEGNEVHAHHSAV